jgi:hypothetical protein
MTEGWVASAVLTMIGVVISSLGVGMAAEEFPGGTRAGKWLICVGLIFIAPLSVRLWLAAILL